MHLARAAIAAAQGQFDIKEVYDHFMRVNEIDWPTAKNALDDAFELHVKRSKRKWTTDYGPYAEVMEERRAQFPDGRIPMRK